MALGDKCFNTQQEFSNWPSQSPVLPQEYIFFIIRSVFNFALIKNDSALIIELRIIL